MASSIAVPCLLALLIGCGGGPASESAVSRVESPGLGIVLSELTAGVRVAVNEGGRLELTPSDEALGGRLSVVAGEPQSAGVNLVEAVKAHRDELVARPGGVYGGQRELGSPLGTAFYSRGRFEAAGETVEETVIFVIHPWGDRRLDIIYRYPAGEDSQERIETLFELLGAVEGMPAADPA